MRAPTVGKNGGKRSASHYTVQVDTNQGLEHDRQQRSDCVVGGDRTMGDGARNRPVPITHTNPRPVRAGPLRQPESGKERAGNRPNCVESARVQWSSRQTQIPTTTPYVQTLKYSISAISGYETGVRRDSTSAGPAGSQPSSGPAPTGRVSAPQPIQFT